MYISIIIPAYNEEKRIKETLLKVSDYLIGQRYDYEIIVVDDGSRDKTTEIVKNLENKVKNLVIIRNEKNRGKGAVVRQGLLVAKGKYRLFTDADNSTPIAELEKLFPYIKQGYDVVIGSRAIKGANVISPQPWPRKLVGQVCKLMVKIFGGLWGFYDTQCGFKIFSAESVDSIFPKCRINGWLFDVEALLLAKKLGYSVKEVPISWSDSPGGTKVKIKGIVQAAFDLFRIRWYAARIKQIKLSKN